MFPPSAPSPSAHPPASAPSASSTNVVGFMLDNHPDKTITGSVKFAFDEISGEPGIPVMQKNGDKYIFKGTWTITTDKGPVTKEETLTVRVPDDAFGPPRSEEEKILTALLMVKTYRSGMKAQLKPGSRPGSDPTANNIAQHAVFRSKSFDLKTPMMTLSSLNRKVTISKDFGASAKTPPGALVQTRLARMTDLARAIAGQNLSLSVSGPTTAPASAPVPSAPAPARTLPPPSVGPPPSPTDLPPPLPPGYVISPSTASTPAHSGVTFPLLSAPPSVHSPRRYSVDEDGEDDVYPAHSSVSDTEAEEILSGDEPTSSTEESESDSVEPTGPPLPPYPDLSRAVPPPPPPKPT